MKKQDLPEIIVDLLRERELYVVYGEDHKLELSTFLEHAKDFGFSLQGIESHKGLEEHVRLYLHKIAILVIDPRNPISEGLKREPELTEMVEDLLVLSVNDLTADNIQNLMLLLNSDKALLWFEKLREEFDLRSTFLYHTESLIDQLEAVSLEIEHQPNSKTIVNQLFNLVHTFKGASGFVRPKTLFEFTHHFEDLIKDVQSGERQVNSSVVTLFLESIDMIKNLRLNIKKDLFHVIVLEKVLQFFERKAVASLDREIAGLPSILADATDPLSEFNLQATNEIKKQSDVKVGLELLDQMLETTGEMTVIRNMLNKIIRSVERRYGQDREVAMLSELLKELHKTNDSIQRQMTNLRELPVREILRPLFRVVRDTANYCQKKVTFETTGQDLRIDTSLADVLNQTLIHLVRNSVDHGIELPEERLAKGKNAQGELKINVSYNRDTVQVEIVDDGKGIDPEVIRRKVIEKKILEAEVARRLGTQDIIQYIFSPGFSTAETVTDISGRGVGMGAVKESVEAIGGRLIIISEVNLGTTTTLLLPIPKTARIIDCLFVNCVDRNFGIPQEGIQRIIRIHEGNRSELVRFVGGGYVFSHELGIMPIIELSDTLFGVSKLVGSNVEFDLLVIQTDSHRPFALAIESVLDVEDAVVKKIEPFERQLKVYSGATFVGDGSVGLIIDLDGVAERHGLLMKKRNLGLANDKLKNQSKEPARPNRFIVFSVVDLESPLNLSADLEENPPPKLFAIRESEVFRVEELSADRLKDVHGIPRIQYRESCLSLMDLRRFGTDQCMMDGDLIDKSKSCFAIISKFNKTQFVGLLVEKVHDIFESTAEVIEPVLQVPGIEGTFIHNENIYTLLNARDFIESLLFEYDQDNNLEARSF